MVSASNNTWWFFNWQQVVPLSLGVEPFSPQAKIRCPCLFRRRQETIGGTFLRSHSRRKTRFEAFNRTLSVFFRACIRAYIAILSPPTALVTCTTDVLRVACCAVHNTPNHKWMPWQPTVTTNQFEPRRQIDVFLTSGRLLFYEVSEGWEPITDIRFFRSFFAGVFQPKEDYFYW